MTDLNARMPPGNDVTQRTVTKPAFSEDLLDAVLHRANLQQAWKQVRANKGAAGIDGMTIEEFPAWVKGGHWSVVQQSIRSGDYQPAPVRRVEIDKPDGGKRQLGIPTVVDRVIQQAIAQTLVPIFDPGFSMDSYGFRPGRNAHQAVRRVQSILKEGRRFAVDVDLSKFFDRVNHDLLMTHLGYKVRDKRLLGLIARYLRAGIIDNQLYLENREGVPQGGPLTPTTIEQTLGYNGACASPGGVWLPGLRDVRLSRLPSSSMSPPRSMWSPSHDRTPPQARTPGLRAEPVRLRAIG